MAGRVYTGGAMVEAVVVRDGARLAALGRAVMAVAGALVAASQSPEVLWLVLAFVVVPLWHAGLAVLLWRGRRDVVVPVDAALVASAALLLPELVTVPPPGGGYVWGVALCYVLAITAQWYTRWPVGLLVTAVMALVVLAQSMTFGEQVWGLARGHALWLVAQALMSRAVAVTVRRGARRVDRQRAVLDQARLDERLRDARRASIEDHVALVHDTVAATLTLAAAPGSGGGDRLADQASADTDRLGAAGLLPSDESPDQPAGPGAGPRPGQGQSPPADLAGPDWLARVVDAPREGRLHVEVDDRRPAQPPHRDRDRDRHRDRHRDRGEPVPPVEVRQALVDAAAEALRNVARHAGTGRARLLVRPIGERGVGIDVVDEGVGFDPETLPRQRYGLRSSIRDRMLRVGGQARVRSSPGSGTTVELRWPAGAGEAAEARGAAGGAAGESASGSAGGPSDTANTEGTADTADAADGGRAWASTDTDELSAVLRWGTWGVAGLVLLVLYRPFAVERPDDAAVYAVHAAAYACSVVVWSATVLLLTDRLGRAGDDRARTVRRVLVALALAAALAATAVVPTAEQGTARNWAFGVTGWLVLTLTLDRSLTRVVPLLALPLATSVVVAAAFAEPWHAELSEIAGRAIGVLGPQLLVVLAGGQLRRSAEAAAALQREEQDVRAAGEVSAALHRERLHRAEHVSALVGHVLSELTRLGPAQDPDDGLRQRCAVAAARLRRLLATWHSPGLDPLAVELDECLAELQRLGLRADLVLRGAREVPVPSELRRQLCDLVLAVAADARHHLRVTVVATRDELRLSVLADRTEAARVSLGLGPPEPVAGGLRTTVHDLPDHAWVEAVCRLG